MSNRDGAYNHQADIPGTQTRGEGLPDREHRDSALGNVDERNEIREDQRGRAEGPTTHDDTRVTRKDGA